jgi:hypothetical protein
MKLTTELHLVLRSRIVEPYLHSPHWLHGIVKPFYYNSDVIDPVSASIIRVNLIDVATHRFPTYTMLMAVPVLTTAGTIGGGGAV